MNRLKTIENALSELENKIELVGLMSKMKDGDKILIGYFGKKYEINANIYSSGTPSFSIYLKEAYGFQGMNVEKITSNNISLYTFDMMKTQTKYKMAIKNIKIISFIEKKKYLM